MSAKKHENIINWNHTNHSSLFEEGKYSICDCARNLEGKIMGHYVFINIDI